MSLETIQPSSASRFPAGSKRFPDSTQSKQTVLIRSRNTKSMRQFARYYILNQLRKHNQSEVADRLSNPEDAVEDDLHDILHAIANQLANEREQQFEDILYHLQLTSQNLKETYMSIVSEIFRDDIHWGRIVAFIVFSGSLAVYCAEHRMEDKVKDVIDWTEEQMESRVRDWVQEKGGLQAFMDHFDDERWKVEIPQFLMGAGLAAAVIAGGVLLIKKFL